MADRARDPCAVPHLTTDQLTAGLAVLREAPAEGGIVDLVVARPEIGARSILEAADFDTVVGLVGDTWSTRISRSRPGGAPNPDAQLNITSSRSSLLIAGDDEANRSLFGDQLHIDMDLSETNMPAGTRLAIGSAVIEITTEPHTGCAKFTQRFGLDAMQFVNSPVGRELNLRGRCAKVVVAGTIRRGDAVTKVPAAVLA